MGQPLNDRHAAIKVGVDRQHRRAVRERLHELGDGDLSSRKHDDGGDAGRRRVSRKRGRGISRRGTADGANLPPLGNHLAHHRHEDGHAKVLERARVRVAAQFHPHFVDPDPASERFGQKQVGAPLVHRHDVVVLNLGAHPFLLAPDARPIRPDRALVSLVEQSHPRRGTSIAQRLEVMRDLQQSAARRAPVDDRVERVGPRASSNTAKDGSVAHAGTPVETTDNTGSATGASPWNSKLERSRIARSIAESGAGSRLTTNGRRPIGNPCSCRIASMLIE